MELELVTPLGEIGDDDGYLFTARLGNNHFTFSYLPIGRPMSLLKMARSDAKGNLVVNSLSDYEMVNCDSLKHGLEILGVTIKGLP